MQTITINQAADSAIDAMLTALRDLNMAGPDFDGDVYERLRNALIAAVSVRYGHALDELSEALQLPTEQTLTARELVTLAFDDYATVAETFARLRNDAARMVTDEQRAADLIEWARTGLPDEDTLMERFMWCGSEAIFEEIERQLGVTAERGEDGWPTVAGYRQLVRAAQGN